MQLVCRSFATSFVPKHSPVAESDLVLLRNFIETSRRLLVLTGAGISTESGIPDYRSEGVGLYARTNHKPIKYQEFVKSEETRRRYWARNYVGWGRFSSVKPNEAHRRLRDLEEEGKVSCVVTQNVDDLHFKAGSSNVIELHGTAFKVICLSCPRLFDRHLVQERLRELNPRSDLEIPAMIRPDGDVELPAEFVRNFHPPFCDCGGVLKPDIVFFGDNVPRSRVEAVREQVANCDALLVLGSSVSVFSGYRIVLQAVEEGKDVGIVNIGTTRADDLAQFKIEAKCGDILTKVA